MITATIPYEGGLYEGQVVNGEPHGWGKLTYLNDVVYEGDWRKGQEHGHGTITWRNGSLYSGEFDQGEPFSTSKHFLAYIYRPSGPQTVSVAFIGGHGGALLTLLVKLPQITQSNSTGINVGITMLWI
ncbi:hypothetical protein QTG54_005921 [Skeletonema marinoi]|uniref:MORN repeat-containing protein 5 n=1 Tax=Skeletonema marinoi TaxID=267567 RepID=A0AAD8YE19_9STRA|nr:hypothetical protein QTG54_005921 [Skeletonema marinoi]